MKPTSKIYIETLEAELQRHADTNVAKGQSAYMKNKFSYFGLKTPTRREVVKPFLHKDYLPAKSEVESLVKQLWQKPQREFHYVGQELLYCYKKHFTENDIELMEYMLSHQSWWDTVDYISVHLVGTYFMKFPDNKKEILTKWLFSNHFWLQRASILYQLKYKQQTDLEWMKYAITHLLGSKEFFINKAIGWVLREYSRTDAEWVIDFVEAHPTLSNLSKREALRLIK